MTKFGAVTGRTEGNVVDTDLDLYVNYSFGTFLFKRQVLIECRDGSDNTLPQMGTRGRSSSMRVRNQAVAMIFAASGRFAVACPLADVLKQLAAKAQVANFSLVI